MNTEENELLNKLSIIEDTPHLLKEWRKVYATDFDVTRAGIKHGHIKKQAIELINTLTVKP